MFRACFLTLLMAGSATAQSTAAPRLPGARPAIDAADHPSIQAAIDALGGQGGIVRLPAGEFEIARPLVISADDVRLEGCGTATHIKNQNTAGLPALVIRPKTAEQDRRARIWRVSVANLLISGNEQSGHGIDAYGVNEILLDAVSVSHHGQDGIRLDSCYEDARVVDSLVTYNGRVGLHILACHDIVVAANQFEENQDAVHCADSFNLCMSGNNVDDHLRHGVVIENTYGSIVSSNMIEECQGVGIILDRDAYGITLSANTIAHEYSGGIDLRDSHGCVVSGNSFPIVRDHALAIGPASARITVSGNVFSNTYQGNGQSKRQGDDDRASGIVLDGTQDIAICGNTFAGLATKALALVGQPSRRVTFTGNVLVEVDSDHARLVDSVVSGNIERE